MAIDRYTNALEEGLKDVGPTRGVSNEQERAQINSMIERVRVVIAQKLGDAGSVRIEPWWSTNEGDGQRFVVTDSDGLEFQLFTVLVSFSDYPITLRIRNEVSEAVDRKQFDDKLAELLKHPDVAAVVQHVTNGGSAGQ